MRTIFLTTFLTFLIVFSSACKGSDQSKANSNNANATNPNGSPGNPATMSGPNAAQQDPTQTGVPSNATNGAAPASAMGTELSMIAMDFHSSLLQGDKARLEPLLGDEYRRTRLDGKVVDKAQELAALKKSDAMFSMEAQPAQINGDTATVTGKLNLNAADMTGKTKSSMQTTDTFKKRNDKWVVVSSVEKKN